ncbi:Basement membrane-specific heparan sulfate proteoglycan core protein [Trichinella britovi]|uniref:Basement membrane-specific heparan sulfate proteoglycan core protein n=2 Tax=Trichinella britovi TaxID=45882 RepID=A0A0V1D365_TRIBR|nr:Basement membrane-specific heparan sulfate proteoglycan core protein [Trichinella britovi]
MGKFSEANYEENTYNGKINLSIELYYVKNQNRISNKRKHYLQIARCSPGSKLTRLSRRIDKEYFGLPEAIYSTTILQFPLKLNITLSFIIVNIKHSKKNTGLCKKNSCKNGGCCAVLSETHFQCLCAHGFKGTLCEEAVSTLEEIAITLSNSYVTTVIAICSLVAAAFLYLSGKAVRRHRKRRRARYSKQLKAPEVPKTLSTETNL